MRAWYEKLILAYRTIKSAGVAQTTRSALNFTGSVTVTDDPANDQTTVNVSGGGGSTPTGTGIPHIVGGVQNAAASLIVNADVSSGAGIAGSKVSPDFGSQNVRTTGYIGVGASVAASGDMRFAARFAMYYLADNAVDHRIVAETSAYVLAFGNNDCSFYADAYSVAVIRIGQSGGAVYLAQIAGVDRLTVAADGVRANAPILGDASYSSPYGAHGGVTITPPSDADVTLSAAQAAVDWVQLNTGSWTSGHSLIFPALGAGAAGYYKTVFNNSSQTATISTGSGTTKTLASGSAQRFWFDTSGVLRASATFTP